MSIDVLTIQTIGDDRRRDSTSGAIDPNKKLRAVNDTLQRIHSHRHWDFTTRRQLFNYYQDEVDYNVPDVLSIADFKDVKDLRVDGEHTTRFTHLDPNAFALDGNNMNTFAVEYRLGDPILRINYADGPSMTTVGNTSDHDADGTWTADTSTSDATNVSTDTTEYIEGGGSVMYDIDVSQSVNNQADIYVTTSSSVDLSDYVDYGAAFLDWYIPAIDQITGATLRWGSSDSAYYTRSVTTAADNGTLVQGWNHLKFDWNGATSSGTPSASAIDYLLFRTSYSATQVDDTGFRINNLQFKLPKRFELLYYSSYVVRNSSGVWIPEATATSDVLLIPDRYRNVVVDGYVANLMSQMGKDDEAMMYERRFEKGLKDMAREFGTNVATANRTFRPAVRWNS